jgi:tetratricopeptide (TPR) repeat protein
MMHFSLKMQALAHHRFFQLFLALLAFALVAQPAWAATVIRSAVMQADRFADAPYLKQLPLGTEVSVLKAEAGWSQIRVGTTTGWVRASSISGEGATQSKLAELKNGRDGANNVLVTTGVRGEDPLDKLQVTKLRQEAAIYAQQKNWLQFEARYRAILVNPAAQAIDFMNLAITLGDNKNFAEATILHEQAVQLEPQNDHVQNAFCWHWLQQNQALKARPCCEAALSLDSTKYLAALNIGHSYLLNDDLTIAQLWYKKAIDLAPNAQELHHAVVADFDFFIANGWVMQAAQKYKNWFAYALKAKK